MARIDYRPGGGEFVAIHLEAFPGGICCSLDLDWDYVGGGL